ncbi:MAG: hypothetical protein AB7O24_00560 [Kofleriaceae bacterium]
MRHGARAWLSLFALGVAAPAAAQPKPASAPPAAAQPARLPAPKFLAGTQTFVIFGTKPAAIRVSWEPVPGAARYRARWTDAGAPSDVELTSPVFEHTSATAGQHELAVTPIDAAGQAGTPASISIDLVEVRAIAPGDEAPSASTAFAVGTRFTSPGLECRLGDAEPAQEVVAKTAGAHTLSCGGAPGQPRVSVPVVVAPVVVAVRTAAIPRGEPTTVSITVASVAPIGDRLDVEAVGDLDLGEAQRTDTGIDLPVTVLPSSEVSALIIRAGTVELGRVALEPAAPKPIKTVRGPAWFALDIGAQVGAFITPQEGSGATFLGKPMQPSDTLGSGPFGGLRAGLFPTRRVGFELETSIVTSSYMGRDGIAAFWVNRGQLAVRLVDDRRFGLRVVGGAGLLSVLTEAGTSQRSSTGSVHYGAAFTIETRPRVSIRLGALHVITVAQDAGYAHCLELQVGVVTRFGRRDRWK